MRLWMFSMPAPTRSVLMTSYHDAQDMGAALASVFASTVADVPLIMVDDYFRDQLPVIVRQYARTDRRLHVVTHATNLGNDPNRNQAPRMLWGSTENIWMPMLSSIPPVWRPVSLVRNAMRMRP